MMDMATYLIVSFLATTSLAHAPQNDVFLNPCISKQTCQECIQLPSCGWCYDLNFTGSARCFQPSYPLLPPEEQCKEEFTYTPDNSLMMLSNLELSKIGGGYHWGMGNGHRIVQVAPQRLKLRLRARQSYTIFMGYTQAKDYPIDLYYLMDLSRSMYDKEKLSLLGDQLAQTMQNITSDYTIGFGSFIDKAVKMPNISTLPEKLIKPCDDCVAPYGFHHHMSLSTNTDRFSKMVKQANVSENLDATDGGFDAIMQSVVCRNQIGWREQARGLLVVSTDSNFHYAGDGKLGGIVKPNDGQCHLTPEGYYDKSSYQDYPSIEQINLAAKKNSINVIFAVTGNTTDIYDQLAKHIEGASTAKLEKDSSNIVELIKQQYQQISSSVEMKHNASSAVSIRFHTQCHNAITPLVNTNKCVDIKVGDIINFNIDIEVLKCPKKEKDRFQTIQIYPVGLSDSLIIDLEMLCKCDCGKPGNKENKCRQ